jgi:hypothetical protein
MTVPSYATSGVWTIRDLYLADNADNSTSISAPSALLDGATLTVIGTSPMPTPNTSATSTPVVKVTRTPTPSLTPTVTPTPNFCLASGKVSIQTQTTGGGLLVTLTTNDPQNKIQAVVFGTGQQQSVNGLVDLPDGRSGLVGVFAHIPTQPTPSLNFTVRRQVAGQPTTVFFTVQTTCGTWTTFVGGGAAAGF